MRIREIEIKYHIREATAEEKENGYMDKVSSADDVVKHFSELADSGIEKFSVLFLNSRNKILVKQNVEVGTVNQATPFIREIFRVGIACDASGIICVHNHPSGDPSPSREDKTYTDTLVKAGEILGIKVLDHVIVARELETDRINWFSFADKGRIQ